MKNITSSFLGHPVSTWYLAAINACERFAFFGFRSMLVLFLTNTVMLYQDMTNHIVGLTWIKNFIQSFSVLSSDNFVSNLYGVITFVFLVIPIIGGILSDLCVGKKYSIIIGSILITSGCMLMMIESIFLIGLVMIFVGEGLIRPTILSLMSGLYQLEDSRLDSGFAILSLAINIGAFFAPLICGTIGQKYGLEFGFLSAGIGMLCGLVIYSFGFKKLYFNQTQITNSVPFDFRQLLILFGLLITILVNFSFCSQLIHAVSLNSSLEQYPFLDSIISLIVMVVIIWRWSINSNSRHSGYMFRTGAAIFLITISSLLLLFEYQLLNYAIYTIVIIAQIILGITALSLISKKTASLVLTTIMGFWLANTFVINAIQKNLMSINQQSNLVLVIIISFVSGMLFIVLDKKKQ